MKTKTKSKLLPYLLIFFVLALIIIYWPNIMGLFSPEIEPVDGSITPSISDIETQIDSTTDGDDTTADDTITPGDLQYDTITSTVNIDGHSFYLNPIPSRERYGVDPVVDTYSERNFTPNSVLPQFPSEILDVYNAGYISRIGVVYNYRELEHTERIVSSEEFYITYFPYDRAIDCDLYYRHLLDPYKLNNTTTDYSIQGNIDEYQVMYTNVRSLNKNIPDKINLKYTNVTNEFMKTEPYSSVYKNYIFEESTPDMQKVDRYYDIGMKNIYSYYKVTVQVPGEVQDLIEQYQRYYDDIIVKTVIEKETREYYTFSDNPQTLVNEYDYVTGIRFDDSGYAITITFANYQKEAVITIKKKISEIPPLDKSELYPTSSIEFREPNYSPWEIVSDFPIDIFDIKNMGALTRIQTLYEYHPDYFDKDNDGKKAEINSASLQYSVRFYEDDPDEFTHDMYVSQIPEVKVNTLLWYPYYYGRIEQWDVSYSEYPKGNDEDDKIELAYKKDIDTSTLPDFEKVFAKYIVEDYVQFYNSISKVDYIDGDSVKTGYSVRYTTGAEPVVVLQALKDLYPTYTYKSEEKYITTTTDEYTIYIGYFKGSDIMYIEMIPR